MVPKPKSPPKPLIILSKGGQYSHENNDDTDLSSSPPLLLLSSSSSNSDYLSSDDSSSFISDHLVSNPSLFSHNHLIPAKLTNSLQSKSITCPTTTSPTNSTDTLTQLSNIAIKPSTAKKSVAKTRRVIRSESPEGEVADIHNSSTDLSSFSQHSADCLESDENWEHDAKRKSPTSIKNTFGTCKKARKLPEPPLLIPQPSVVTRENHTVSEGKPVLVAGPQSKALGARLGMRAPVRSKPVVSESSTLNSRPLGMRMSGLARPISFPPASQSALTTSTRLKKSESVSKCIEEQVQNLTNFTIKKFKPPTFKKAPVGAISQYNPNLNRVLGMRAGVKLLARPLHDPDETGALVLWRPAELSEAEKLKLKEEDKLVAVVVDPTLSRILRPHQIDGVIFMYECVTGLRVPNVQGCIMADEMGLGKTLQCITLLWTLLRQSPRPGKPLIDKCIIVCPSSLVRNWANEIIKWLGANAVHPLCADNKGSKAESTKALQQFVMAKGRCIINPILIISYESLRLYAPTLGQTQIGLMLCDEGHRLKNPQSQTFLALNALNIPRRVILSGTPIQNDLTEYFALLTFACPGLLGPENEFRRNFELPINRGRDADASDKERIIADEKLQELVSLAGKVQIRRTQDLLRKYLPTKQEHVVFCQMMPEQLNMYTGYLQSPEVKALLRGKDSQPLKAIGYLKKLVNHPCLVEESRKLMVDESGKLIVLDRMLLKIKTTTRDKIVLVSNYTQTLDVFEKLCATRGYGYLRLDGTLVVKKRQKLVDQFNDPAAQEFIFLLSSKAGGCGINLIGANRLVLFDPDWNPASDMQALARVWRDGQKKECFIYRFIATGTIEEKIFQRQCHKQMLSNCVVDDEQEVERHFSLENLRMLFEYNANTLSDTHDTFKCKRCVNYRQSRPPPRDNVSARNAATDMSLWNHYSRVEHTKIPDPMLRECGKDIVTFVFHNETQ